MHALVTFSFFILAVGAFGGMAYYGLRSSVRVDKRSLDKLLASLQRVDVEGVQCIAHNYMAPQRDREMMEPEVIWHLVGGEAGLRSMQENANLLLSLAAHTIVWNSEEGTVIAESMRRDAVRLCSAVRRIRLGMLSQLITGRHWVSVPFHLQEAASAYHMMRMRLFALYESSHAGMLPALTQAA